MYPQRLVRCGRAGCTPHPAAIVVASCGDLNHGKSGKLVIAPDRAHEQRPRLRVEPHYAQRLTREMTAPWLQG
eukprot:2934190-Amphidinium_carterae.1